MTDIEMGGRWRDVKKKKKKMMQRGARKEEGIWAGGMGGRKVEGQYHVGDVMGKKTGREDVLGKENVVYSAFQNKSYKVLHNKSLEAAGIITHSETTKIRHEKLKF